MYIPPRTDEIVDTLKRANFFTTLDQTHGYWQVPIAECDKEKTAFIAPNGLYQYNYTPFGLCNAAATFQRLMDVTLAGLQGISCLCYLDDVLVFGNTFDEMLGNLDEVLHRLAEAGLKLRLSKCKFAQKQVSYLGHIISGKGVAPDPSKIEAVENYPIPTNLTELRAFLGIASYYRKFVRNFAQIAHPLHVLLKKGRAFDWGTAQGEAFAKIKCCLTSAPILIHPDFSEPFVLQTDASCLGIGAVLSQLRGGVEHPIAYASRSLRPAEKNYSINELEALAVVTFTQHFRPYLYGQKFTVQTDNSGVRAIIEKPNTTGRLARWGLALQGFDLEIKHRKGKSNSNADALSRGPATTPKETVDELEGADLFSTHCEPLETPITKEILKQGQRDDTHWAPIIRYLETSELPEEINECKRVQTAESLYCLIDSLLYRIHPRRKGVPQLVISKELVATVLGAHHEDRFAGHFGFHKTWLTIRERYFWKNMFNDVKQHCKGCLDCALHKTTPCRNKASLRTIPITGAFDCVGVDIMGPLTQTLNGNRYIIVFTDYLTKYSESCALPDIKAERVARVFVERIVLKHGCPSILQSDNASNFKSEILRKICLLCGTKKTFTTPYHPMGNGEVERQNKTLATIISMYVNDRHTDWDEHLPFATFAYNNQIQESTKYSPFYLLHGRECRIPIDNALNFTPNRYLIDVDDYAINLAKHMTNAWDNAKININTARQTQKQQYDKKAHEPEYKIGMRVVKINTSVKTGLTKKLTAKYEGPFTIHQIRYPLIRIAPEDASSDDLGQWVHVNQVKTYFDIHFQDLNLPGVNLTGSVNDNNSMQQTPQGPPMQQTPQSPPMQRMPLGRPVPRTLDEGANEIVSTPSPRYDFRKNRATKQSPDFVYM